MDQTSASDLKLEEGAIKKQAKHSNAAANICRDLRKLEIALPYPREFRSMSLEQLAKWETDNYTTTRLDITFGGIAMR